MKALKMTLGALTVLALALSAGCQSTPPNSSENADNLVITYYRVQLSDPKASDVDWKLVTQELSNDASLGAYLWKNLVGDGDGDTAKDPIRMMGYSKISLETLKTVMLDQAVNTERLINALSKQGKVSLIHESKYTSPSSTASLRVAKLKSSASNIKEFTPQKQCGGVGGTPDSNSVFLASGVWTTEYVLTYTPLDIIGDKSNLKFTAEFTSKTSIPDCSNPGELETLRDLTTSIEQGIFLDRNASVVLSGIRDRGIDKTLVNPEPSQADTDNEVVLMLLKPNSI